MRDLNGSDHATSRETVLLSKVAASLGCPVSAFSEPPLGALGETDELLRLWVMIEGEQDRAQVLAFMRALALPKPPQEATE